MPGSTSVVRTPNGSTSRANASKNPSTPARTSRRVALTAAGEASLPEARRVLDAAGHALEVGRRAAHGHAGEVRVGYAEDIGPRLFQLAVPRAPSVRVLPRPMTTPDQLAALAEHRLDLAFGWEPDQAPGLAVLPVAREPLVATLAAGHPLAAGAAVDPARLSRRPLVLIPRDGLVWRRGDAGDAVAALVAVVRELRDTGAFAPPGLEP
ncbi:LysR family transcriptional regulator [Spirillospora sp. NBC_01491]|uniref:LysR family transcriptional regulator n=1 Tax=Spirillospora sp. NBC_01491 TaxID=2976007 RepID=UPI002E31059E|nr:LysR substrate-binding domain-containing protein [Spirillospora sp. NBC_01491]